MLLEKNMSFKRNLAVKAYKSKYIAFIDSDAYPSKNWLTIADNFLKKIKEILLEVQAYHFRKKIFFKRLHILAKDLILLQDIRVLESINLHQDFVIG